VLSAPSFLLGVLELTVALGGAALGANRVRSRLLPGWSGPPAWVVDLLFTTALLLWVGEALGSFGLLEPLSFALLAAGIGAVLWLRVGPPERFRAQPPPAPPAGRVATVAAAGVTALVAAHWSVPTQQSLAHGMAGYDTLWYHGPFAAEFARDGSTFDFLYVAPRYLSWFFPANSELINAFGILTVGRDTLSVLLNLGWLAAALLAAWAVGRPFGVGPHSLIAVALLLDSGVMADQGGSGRNDAIAIFFVLAIVAVLVNAWAAAGEGGGLPWRALVPAGLATGLMIGTKVNLLAPALGLAVGIPLLAAAGRRRRALAAFLLPVLAGGGFWYLRNLLREGNPLPWITEVGPITLPGPGQPLGGRDQFSIAHYLTDGSVWEAWFGPDLHRALGVLWPLLAGLALFVILAFALRGPGLFRVLGIAALLGVAGWFLHGTSAEGPPGEPIGFFSSLRHVAPALVVGLALAPLAPGLRSERARVALLVAMLVSLPFVDASGANWVSGYLWPAVAIGLAVFAVLLAAIRWPPGRLARGPLVLGAGAALAIAVAGLWAIQDSYLEDRYRRAADIRPGGVAAAARWARDLEDTRIATTSDRSYALLGIDLSNTVIYPGQRHGDGGFTDWRTCPEWRRALNRGGFRYAVIAYDNVDLGRGPPPPEARWIAGDPATRLVLRRGSTAIYRITGPLDPARCPPPLPGDAARLPERNT
jgi:hypothetical protein